MDGHRGALLAQLADPFAEPVDQLLARVAGLGRGGVADDRAPVLPEGDPADRATRSSPWRCRLASKQVLVLLPVIAFAL